MANSVQERLKLKRMALDVWSNREKLALASAVERSGDQNWSCVSRTIKPFAEPNRPHDWFSQKNCAQQYACLLESVETPKRKKRISGSADRSEVDTPAEMIVKKLKEQHQMDLRANMEEARANYLRLWDEVFEVCDGEADDERIQEMIRADEEEAALKEQKKKDHQRFLQEREERRLEVERAWKPGLPLASLRRESSLSEPSSDADSPMSEPLAVDVPDELLVKPTPVPAPTPTSPLLTSLLKSPSSAPPAGGMHLKYSGPQSTSPLHVKSGATPPGATNQSMLLKSPPAAPPPAGNSLIHLKSPVAQSLPPTPSSILHSAITSPMRGASPTIASLLNSSPVQQLSLPPGSVSPKLTSLVSVALSGFDDTKPMLPTASQGAPTLSMLLELPPSMPGKPLPVLLNQPPPYAEHLGPPPPYSLATEYLQKQRAEQAAAQAAQQAQLAIRNVEKELLLPTTTPIHPSVASAYKQPIKADLPDLDDIEEVIAVDTSRSQQQKQQIVEQQQQLAVQQQYAITDHTDHTYVEHNLDPAAVTPINTPAAASPKTADKKELDVFEFGEEEENDANIGYLKSNPKRQAKKEVAKPAEPPIDEEADIKLEEVPSEVEKDVSQTAQADEPVEQANEEAEIKQGEASNEEGDQAASIEEPEVKVEPEEPTVVPETETTEEEIQEEEQNDTTQAESTTTVANPRLVETPVVEDEKSNENVPLATAVAAAVKRRRGTATFSASDSIPNSPVPVTEEEKEYRTWKKSVLLLHSSIESHKSASLFLKPITDEQAPGYSGIIRRPMDLSTIKRNIESGAIRTTDEYQRDLMLMFFNARMFNKTNGVIYQQAVKMQTDSLEALQTFKEPPSKRETRTHEKSVKTRASLKPVTELKRKRTSTSTSSDVSRKKIQLGDAQ